MAKRNAIKDWPRKLDAAIKRKFKVRTETYFDFTGCFRYITVRADGKPIGNGGMRDFIANWMKRNVEQKAA